MQIIFDSILSFFLSGMINIDNAIPLYFIKVPVLYAFLVFFWILLLVLYEGLLRGISSLVDFIYLNSRKNKSVSIIRILSEWYYLFDKLIYFLSPHLFSYDYSDDNILKKSNILSPIVLYRTVFSYIYSMFVVNKKNLLIWAIILIYFNPPLLQHIVELFNTIKWSDILHSVRTIEFKKINDFLSFMSLLLSIIVILLLTISTFRWRAKKKIREEKFEKVIKYQEQIEELLCIILFKSRNNIDRFNKMIKHWPDMYGQIITGTEKYHLVEGTLKFQNSSYIPITTVDEIIRNLESFRNNIEQINEILKNISDSRLKSVFVQVNKSIQYESLELGLYSRTYLNMDLIERDTFKDQLDHRLKNLRMLCDKFSKFREVKSGWLSAEDYELEYNKFGSSFSLKEIVKYAEEELLEAMLDFDQFLHRKLEDAIFSTIILEEYIHTSQRNTRSNLFELLLSLFTK
ncbi:MULTISPECIES: hypothetical protein [unclassified Paenibacillus]|uniref:hypothetical protein n=1 Tax=unclassified Paenibacillus TaxID=185978 RepID=UPI0030FBB35E